MKRKQVISALLDSGELVEDPNQAYQYTLIALSINVYEDYMTISTRNTDTFSLRYSLAKISDIHMKATHRAFMIIGLEEKRAIATISYDCMTDFDL